MAQYRVGDRVLVFREEDDEEVEVRILNIEEDGDQHATHPDEREPSVYTVENTQDTDDVFIVDDIAILEVLGGPSFQAALNDRVIDSPFDTDFVGFGGVDPVNRPPENLTTEGIEQAAREFLNTTEAQLMWGRTVNTVNNTIGANVAVNTEAIPRDPAELNTGQVGVWEQLRQQEGRVTRVTRPEPRNFLMDEAGIMPINTADLWTQRRMGDATVTITPNPALDNHRVVEPEPEVATPQVFAYLSNMETVSERIRHLTVLGEVTEGQRIILRCLRTERDILVEVGSDRRNDLIISNNPMAVEPVVPAEPEQLVGNLFASADRIFEQHTIRHMLGEGNRGRLSLTSTIYNMESRTFYAFALRNGTTVYPVIRRDTGLNCYVDATGRLWLNQHQVRNLTRYDEVSVRDFANQHWMLADDYMARESRRNAEPLRLNGTFRDVPKKSKKKLYRTRPIPELKDAEHYASKEYIA